MNKLMITAATALVMATGAYAQTDSTEVTEEPMMEEAPAANGAVVEEGAPEMGTPEADTAAMGTGEREMMTAPSIAMDGYQAAKYEELTADDLTGARVYGVDGEDIGEVGELLLNDDGSMDRAVIDVGGFLGIGEKAIALTMDEMTVMRPDEGGGFRVYVDSTEEALEDQPEYEG